MLSFGRPTYGRLGRSKADVNSDEGLPEPTAVDGLEELTIVSAAAGVVVSRPLHLGREVDVPWLLRQSIGIWWLLACCKDASNTAPAGDYQWRQPFWSSHRQMRVTGHGQSPCKIVMSV